MTLLLPSVTLVHVAWLKFKSLVPSFTTQTSQGESGHLQDRLSISDHPENSQTVEETHGAAEHQQYVSIYCP